MTKPFKRFPEQDHRLLDNSYIEASKRGKYESIPELVPSEQSAMNYTAPAQIPPRKGKAIAIALIAALLGYGAYKVWDSYFRYDALGTVESEVIGVHAANPGFLKELYVVEGKKVIAGDIVAVIENKDNLRALSKLDDDIALAQSDVVSKNNLIFLTKGEQVVRLLELQIRITAERGDIENLKSAIKFQQSDLKRLSDLAKIKAAGEKEIDTANALLRTSSVQLKTKETLIHTLLAQEKELLVATRDNLSSQLQPLQAKVEFLKNEKLRLQQRLADDVIKASVTGVVTGVQKHPGERITEEPLFYIIADNTSNLVLYYDPADKSPKVNDVLTVYSPSLGKMVPATVSSIAKTVTPVPDQIKRFYVADQKLVKVYMEPQHHDLNSFVTGSIVKRPGTSEIFADLVSVFFPNNAVANDGAK